MGPRVHPTCGRGETSGGDTGDMRRRPVHAATIAAVAVAALLLAGCAADAESGGADGDAFPGIPGPLAADFDPVIPAPGPVDAQGTVLQPDGEPAMLCLGAVAESYPPQCSGPELAGWDWTAVGGEESASGVTWGAYALTGTWDGERFTATEVVQLALVDPAPTPPDPHLDTTDSGATGDDRLFEIQRDLHDAAPFEVLTSTPQNGYLFVDVIYDDGRIQALVDEAYGHQTVVVHSALRGR